MSLKNILNSNRFIKLLKNKIFISFLLSSLSSCILGNGLSTVYALLTSVGDDNL